MAMFLTDIVIRGKKAYKYQELKNIYNFELVDIYMISGVLGFLHNKKDVQDNDGTLTANIPRTVLERRSKKINFLYEIITLHEELDVDPDRAMQLAFEINSVEHPVKMYKKELFDDYALGGIDILYDMLSNVTYDRQVDNIKNILDKYSESYTVNQKTTNDIFEAEGL